MDSNEFRFMGLSNSQIALAVTFAGICTLYAIGTGFIDNPYTAVELLAAEAGCIVVPRLVSEYHNRFDLLPDQIQ